jgi:hypothetical protein
MSITSTHSLYDVNSSAHSRMVMIYIVINTNSSQILVPAGVIEVLSWLVLAIPLQKLGTGLFWQIVSGWIGTFTDKSNSNRLPTFKVKFGLIVLFNTKVALKLNRFPWGQIQIVKLNPVHMIQKWQNILHYLPKHWWKLQQPVQ